MLKVVMIELGDALFDENERLRAHVAESIETMTRMLTQPAERLAVVAIGELAPNAPPEVQEQAFLAVVARLERAGLRALFEPVARTVTLCARSAGAQTQDRLCIESALRQLGAAAGFDECARVTAGAARGLRFCPAAGPCVDFDDWRQLPLLVAAQLDTESLTNTTLALRDYWAHDASIELIDVTNARTGGALDVRVRRWLPIVDPRLGEHSGVLVPFEVTGRIDRASDGRVLGVAFSEPSQEDVLEAVEWIASLAHHGQLAADPNSRGTHVIQWDAKGNRRLIRRGYSR